MVDIEASLSALIEDLKSVTHSLSATIRVLIIRQDDDGPKIALRRLTASPAERMGDPRDDVLLTGTDEDGAPYWQVSANAYAATKGALVHIVDAKKRIRSQCKDLIRIMEVHGRSRVRSELCVPITCEGFVVGTLNLESPVAGAYLTHVQIAQAYAALAAVVVTTHRAELLRTVSESASSILAGLHEAVKMSTLISELREHMPVDLVGKVDELGAIASNARNGAASGSPATDSNQIRVALDAALGALRVARLRVLVSDGATITGPVARVLPSVFMEILRNQYLHGQDGDNGAYVRDSRVQLGGRPYIALMFRNLIGKKGPVEETLRRAYNSPIYRLDRPHLGCFSAGELMRSVGGDCFMSLTHDRMVETMVLIPANEES